MEALHITDSTLELGEVLLKAQKEPVFLHKDGKPVAVLISADEYARLSCLKEACLKSELQTGLDDWKAGRVAHGKLVLERLRKRIRDAVI